MQQLETSFTPPEVTPKKGDREKIKIRFYVFFDGTLNNRTNIEQRLLAGRPLGPVVNRRDSQRAKLTRISRLRGRPLGSCTCRTG